MHEEQKEYDTFYLSRAGYIIPSITGMVSCLSSFIIVFIILKTMHNTAYHRIMFAMSISDIITSTAIALTTLPMPADVIYDFEGPSFGTVGTCTAQGLANIIGSGLSLAANCTLNMYYLCTLRFKMPEAKFSKIVEPICVLVFVPMAICFPCLVTLKNDLINPSPYESLCTAAYYPFECQLDEDVECIRGNTAKNYVEHLLSSVFIAVSINSGIMLVSMMLIIRKFYEDEIAVKRSKGNPTAPRRLSADSPLQIDEFSIEGSDHALDADPGDETSNSSFRHGSTRAIIKEALMYIGAFSLTWLFLIFIFIHPLGEKHSIQAMKLVFYPLQGFWNMLIFIYHKISQIRRADKDETIWDALKVTFCNPRDIPEISISGIEIVKVPIMKNTIPSSNWCHQSHSEALSSAQATYQYSTHSVQEKIIVLSDLDEAKLSGSPPTRMPQIGQKAACVQEGQDSFFDDECAGDELSYLGSNHSNLSGFSEFSYT
jgi:hypothetical protein